MTPRLQTSSAGRPARWGGLALAVSAVLAACVPGAGAQAGRPQLPAPEGPHPVGTTVLHVVDSTRADPADAGRRRELMVQLWYPAASGGGAAARYVPGAAAEAMRRDGYYDVDSLTIDAWSRVRTHARSDAPVIHGTRLPVLVLSHGLGVSRAHYTALVEELASRGYTVAAVDHPYGGVAALPDGRVLTAGADPGDLRNDSTLGLRVQQWAADAGVVLDRLRAMDGARTGRFGGRLDLARAGMLGHSLGGAAAVEACRTDARFRACADLDGALYGPVAETGPARPTLVIRSRPVYSDEELAARGRTREAWEAMGREIEGSLLAILARRPEVPSYLVSVAGTGHMSFSDAPFTFPAAVTRFGGKQIDPLRGHRIVSAYLRAFFERHLDGGSGALLDGPTTLYPEVTFARVDPLPRRESPA